MNIKEVVKTINKSVRLNQNAWDHLYYGRTYMVILSENNIVKFFKTRRGADGYINKQQKISYYDEYFMEMRTCGEGLQVVEIKESYLKNYITDPYIWYWEAKEQWFFGRNPKYLIDKAKRLKVNEEVLKFVENLVNRVITESGFPYIDEYENEQQKTEQVKEEDQTVTLPEQTSEQITVTYKLNDEKNGVEIYFSEKPSEEIRELLKSNGFRWSKQGFWYAKQSEKTISLAQKLAENQIDNTVKEPEQIDKASILAELDDIETYTVSKEIQEREHSAQGIFRSQPIDWTKELQNVLKHYQNQVIELINTTDNSYIILQLVKSIQYFKKHYADNFIKRLQNRANNPSWVVTGPAGINRRRYEKMNNRYDNLMRESIQLTEGIEKRIRKYHDMIETEKRKRLEQQIQAEIAENRLQMDFITETKEFIYMGLKERKRCYVCGDYWITKTWGTYRIFKGNEEVHSMKTTEKLQDAKNYVLYLIKKDQEREQVAV